MARTANFAGARGFTRGTLRISRELAAGMFDAGETLPVSPVKLDAFVNDLADFTRYCGPKTGLALRASVLLLQFSPVWVIGKPFLYTRLSRADRSRYLDKAERSSLPLIVQGLKTVFCILWYDLHPDELPVQTRIAPRAGVAHAALRKRA